MIHNVQINTERLILKSIDPEFIKSVFQNSDKVEIMELFGHDEQGYEYLKMQHDGGMETFSISVLYFLLIEKESGRVIGECGFHTWNKKHRRADVFYSLRNDGDKRKGYMKEALGEVIKFGFKEMNLHRIAGLAADWNEPSLKLLKHYGFQYEGIMREDYLVNEKNEDSVCYSLLSHEFTSKKN